MKAILLLLFITVASLKLNAQQIQGKIIDKQTGETLPFVAISIKTKNKTRPLTQTDFNGAFSLNIPDSLITKKIHIVFSSVGFTNKVLVVKKKKLPAKNVMIEMESNAMTLQETHSNN